MYDIELNESFSLDSPTAKNSHWWKGEPVKIFYPFVAADAGFFSQCGIMSLLLPK